MTTKHTINQRFEKALTVVGIKPAELARQLGTEPVKLYRIIGGRTKPSIQTLEAVVALYPQISTDYIIKGTGPVLNQAEVEIIGQGLSTVSESMGYSTAVPYISMDWYSTFIDQYTPGNANSSEATYPLLNRMGKALANCIIVDVRDNGMSPQINDQAKVLGRLVNPSDWAYQGGGVYAILFRDQLVIKRILENELLTNGLLRG